MKTPVTKQKVTLTPPATFPATVEIHMPGIGLGEITFDFKHREKAQVRELMESFSAPKPADPENPTAAEQAAIKAFEGPKDVDIVLDIAAGWDLPEAFNAKSIERMTELYATSVQAILQAYFAELSGGRAKN